MARAFAKTNDVAIIYKSSDEKARQLENELGCTAYKADVSSAKEVSAAVERIAADFGKIDVLINNAGISRIKMLSDVTELDWYNMIDVHLTGAFNMTKAVLPFMIKRKQGSIINISSIHSLMSQPTNMLYAGTKGAMNAAARVMALDYAKDNIRVNTICPGVVISDVMYDDMDKLDDAGKKQLDAALHRCQPLEPGRMQDIANTALFFASNMSANITGQTLLSDGGTSIKAHDMDC